MPHRDVGIVLFTRDLRVHDNPALHDAVCRHDAVVPAFVLDDRILSGRLAAPGRLAYLAECLDDLGASLAARGASLTLRRGDWAAEALRLASDCGASAVHVAADHGPYATSRLARLERDAARRGVEVRRHPGVAVVEPGAVVPEASDHYAVFTPYHRRWLANPWRAPVPAPRSVRTPSAIASDGAARHALPAGAGRLPRGGERAARRQMFQWLSHGLDGYAERRDQLAAGATSRLSAALHLGCLSPLELAARALARGGDAFVRQLCWRDFHLQVLAARPQAAWADLRPTRRRWHDDRGGLAAWREGRTGYPLVDAAMRQLLAEGFVHNRARMVAASFLTHDLGIDWRHGARHYLAHLVDGDIASNNLSWQWVAGTGYDTNPYRVLNPTLQGRRFDRDGRYIRRWVAELRTVAGDIHDPAPRQRAATGYPEPIVDHRSALRAARSAPP